MAINFPEAQQDVLIRVLADLKAELPKSNPYLKNNFLNAMGVAFANRQFDSYQQLREVLKQMFPDTATGVYLERWGGYKSIYRLPATGSTGFITATGLTGSTIPIGSQWQNGEGSSFTAVDAATVTLVSISLSSLVRSGSTVTATTLTDHGIATGVSVTISGAVQTDYNGTFTVTVTGTDTFIYTIDASPATPATGTILAQYYGASVEVESDGTGQSENLEAGTVISLITPIAGVDNDSYVQYGAVAGGTDQETDEDYRVRVIYAWQNPAATFNEAAIVISASAVAGVTRVFVRSTTPYVGAVTVYIMRDNDENPIPEVSELNAVKAKLLETMPAVMDADDLVVSAPTAVPVPFTFSSLVPNTVTMQNAITENLRVLFQERTDVGVDLPEAAFLSAIYQTVDLDTGDVVESFALSTPTANVAMDDDEIPTLGTITF